MFDVTTTGSADPLDLAASLEHRKKYKYGCKVKGHFKKKTAAKKAACAARVRGRRARVGGGRGKYVVLDCGARKPHRRRR